MNSLTRIAMLIVNLAAVAAIVGVLAWVWLSRPTTVDDPAPAQVTILAGDAQLSGGDIEEEDLDLGLMFPGQRIDVVEGGLIHLSFGIGAVLQLEGPARLDLLESRVFGKRPPLIGGDRESSLSQSAAVSLVSGTVTADIPGLPDGSDFTVLAPSTVALVDDVTFRFAAESDSLAVSVSEGILPLTTVSTRDGDTVALVFPGMNAGEGVRVNPLQRSDVPDLLATARDVMVQSASFPGRNLELNGLTFKYQEGPPTHLVYTDAVEPSPETFVVVDDAIEDPKSVQGLETQVITEQDVQDSLPPGWTATILPGNTMEVEGAGGKYLLNANIVGGRLSITGLPLDVDIGPYLTDVPYLLSVQTDNGQAVVSYLSDRPVDPVAREPVEVERLPDVAPFFESIPLPTELSLEPSVVATNLGFAGLTGLLIFVIRIVANIFIRREEGTITSLLSSPAAKIGERLAVIYGFVARVGSTLRLGVVQGFVTLLLYGFVYSFLAQSSGVFGPNGGFIMLSMILSIGLVSLTDAYARGLAARFMKVPATVGVLPGNLVVALGSVVVSRIMSLAPA